MSYELPETLADATPIEPCGHKTRSAVMFGEKTMTNEEYADSAAGLKEWNYYLSFDLWENIDQQKTARGQDVWLCGEITQKGQSNG